MPEKHLHKHFKMREDTGNKAGVKCSVAGGSGAKETVEVFMSIYSLLESTQPYSWSSLVYKLMTANYPTDRLRGKASFFFFFSVCLDSCHNRISVHDQGFEHWSPHTLNRCRCGPHPTGVNRVRLQNAFCSPECVRDVR